MDDVVTDSHVALAEEIARRALAGVLDQMGRPALPHTERVAAAAAKHGPAAQATGWLHDVVEDTDVTLEELRTQFPGSVVNGVDAMTRRADEDYDAFIARVALDPVGRMVKIEDLRDNSARCGELPGPKGTRLAARYARALAFLGR